MRDIQFLVLAVDLGLRRCIIEGGEVCHIQSFYNFHGDETDDPFCAAMGIAQHSSGVWFIVDLRILPSAAVH